MRENFIDKKGLALRILRFAKRVLKLHDSPLESTPPEGSDNLLNSYFKQISLYTYLFIYLQVCAILRALRTGLIQDILNSSQFTAVVFVHVGDVSSLTLFVMRESFLRVNVVIDDNINIITMSFFPPWYVTIIILCIISFILHLESEIVNQRLLLSNLNCDSISLHPINLFIYMKFGHKINIGPR